MQQRLQRHKPIRHMKTKYEEQMQNSDGLFQRLWSVEDREGTNIRYLVYAYIRSNWRCHNEL